MAFELHCSISILLPAFPAFSPTSLPSFDWFDLVSFFNTLLIHPTAWTVLSFSTFNMQVKSFFIVALATMTEARFGQEGLIQPLIQALSDFGNPGAAGTLAGQSPSVLLAGASACAKVRHPA